MRARLLQLGNPRHARDHAVNVKAIVAAAVAGALALAVAVIAATASGGAVLAMTATRIMPHG
jgi:hypothetical protein